MELGVRARVVHAEEKEEEAEKEEKKGYSQEKEIKRNQKWPTTETPNRGSLGGRVSD